MKRVIAWLLCMIMLLGTVAFAEGEWKNILLLGNDTRDFPKFERSDAIIIISINEAKAKVKLTSIMRDTDVSFAGGGSGKINGAMAAGGPEKAVATVNKNFGTDIEDYIVIDFKQLIQAVDLIGGVDIEIDEGERAKINGYYRDFGVGTEYTYLENSGLVHLSGWQLLTYSRDRSSAGGDYDRVNRQRKMLIALLNELQEKTLDEVLELSDDLLDLVSTNMTDDELKELGTTALALEMDDIEEFRLPVNGTFQDGIFNGVWKIKPNLEKNKKLLQEFIYGTEMHIGASGEKVRKLQQKLLDMGLLNDKVDGLFGNKTAMAVKAAQEQFGLEATGIADETFLELLYA